MLNSSLKILGALETILEKAADKDLEVLATAIQGKLDLNRNLSFRKKNALLEGIFSVVQDEFGFRKAMEQMAAQEEAAETAVYG